MSSRFPPLTIEQSQVGDYIAIQNLQATYMRCLGSGAFDEIVQLFDLDDAEVAITYAGKAPAVGAHAIRQEWEEFDQLFKENGGALGVHTLTTPMIGIDRGGKSGRGAWLSFGYTFMERGFGIAERTAMPSLAAYDNEFSKTASGWKIKSVKWDIVSTLTNVGINPEWGWIAAPREAEFPFAR